MRVVVCRPLCCLHTACSWIFVALATVRKGCTLLQLVHGALNLCQSVQIDNTKLVKMHGMHVCCPPHMPPLCVTTIVQHRVHHWYIGRLATRPLGFSCCGHTLNCPVRPFAPAPAPSLVADPLQEAVLLPHGHAEAGTCNTAQALESARF